MKKLSAKTWVWVAIGAVLGFLLVHYVFIGPKVIPAEFATARTEGERLTEEIVFLANASRQGLDEISKDDAAANTSEALIATSRELLRSKDIRERAVNLSVQLGRMAQALPGISPGSARQIASEAVGYEVGLVSRLITYNDLLNQLFELLRAKFTGKIAETDGKVDAFITNINADANAANDLNKAFVGAMKRFDAVYQ